MEKILSNLPILEEQAKKLFEAKTSRRSRDNTIVLRVMKLRTIYTANKYAFYWVQYQNGRPQMDLVLKFDSGEGSGIDNILSGDFYNSFDYTYEMSLKKTEKLADKIFLLNCQWTPKYLEVYDEKKAKEILESDKVYLACVKARKGKFTFPVWIDENVEEDKYSTVSIWGKKQKFTNPEFINRLSVGDTLYQNNMILSEVDGILCLV